jgi:TrpR family transcriptional regulator, trp operon repressor
MYVKRNRARDKDWTDLLGKMFKITDVKSAAAFCEIFFTYAEREDLPKRVRIVEELIKGELTQREISRTLKVSIANVTRGANAIKASRYNVSKLIVKMNKGH